MHMYRSFVLAAYVFSLIFLRTKSSATIRYLILVCGWCAVCVVVLIGPLGIQSAAKGPYFGPSGYWYVALRIPTLHLSLKQGAGVGLQVIILQNRHSWNISLYVLPERFEI